VTVSANIIIMMSDDHHEGPVGVGDSKRAQSRFRCIVILLMFIAACTIAAIVLPLVLDDCDCGPSSQNIQSPTFQPVSQPTTPVPTNPAAFPTATLAPSAPFSPTVPSSPTIPTFPTESPATSRLDQFIQSLLVPVSGEEVFQDPNSPQYRAAEFLVYNDTFGASLGDVVLLGDRYALSTFYYSMDGDNSWFSCYQNDLNCTAGNAWMDPEVNHCEWSAIRCDTSGRVVDIFFGMFLLCPCLSWTDIFSLILSIAIPQHLL
jgi:hypothetical protein